MHSFNAEPTNLAPSPKASTYATSSAPSPSCPSAREQGMANNAKTPSSTPPGPPLHKQARDGQRCQGTSICPAANSLSLQQAPPSTLPPTCLCASKRAPLSASPPTQCWAREQALLSAPPQSRCHTRMQGTTNHTVALVLSTLPPTCCCASKQSSSSAPPPTLWQASKRTLHPP